MNRIEVYSTDNCPWCDRAKSLLRARGLDFAEIDISSDRARALEMTKRSIRRTVPQIFIDNVQQARKIMKNFLNTGQGTFDRAGDFLEPAR